VQAAVMRYEHLFCYSFRSGGRLTILIVEDFKNSFRMDGSGFVRCGRCGCCQMSFWTAMPSLWSCSSQAI
jgi:hypothetical protein